MKGVLRSSQKRSGGMVRAARAVVVTRVVLAERRYRVFKVLEDLYRQIFVELIDSGLGIELSCSLG